MPDQPATSMDRLSGGALLSAVASGLAVTALGLAGAANPSSFAIGIGKPATAKADALLTDAMATGKSTSVGVANGKYIDPQMGLSPGHIGHSRSYGSNTAVSADFGSTAVNLGTDAAKAFLVVHAIDVGTAEVKLLGANLVVASPDAVPTKLGMAFDTSGLHNAVA